MNLSYVILAPVVVLAAVIWIWRAWDTHRQVQMWREIYDVKFGISLPAIAIPKRPWRRNLGRLIVVARGLTPSRLPSSYRLRSEYGRHHQIDLDGIVESDERSPKRSGYAIWTSDVATLASCMQSDAPSQTLLERLLHDLIYRKEFGVPLDCCDLERDVWWEFLCTGSEDVLGSVPRVVTRSRIPRVCWGSVDHNDPRQLVRVVVS